MGLILKKHLRNVCYPPIRKENQLKDKSENLEYVVISPLAHGVKRVT